MSVGLSPYRFIFLAHVVDTARRRTKQTKSDIDMSTER